MNAEPRYNDIYYQRTTAHSQIIDVVQNKIIALNDLRPPINWQHLFGNAHPVEVEIGFGKGRFLLEASKQYPNVNFIGVERAQKYVQLTQHRFRKYMNHHAVQRTTGTFQNVRLAWTDANYLLSRYIPTQSIRAYHVYFPDPWPKARQQKRRIFRNHEFRNALSQTLSIHNGRLYIATDYATYFHEIQERLASDTTLKPIPSDAAPYNHITTNFEIKYRREGRPLYRAVYQKIQSEAPLPPQNA